MWNEILGVSTDATREEIDKAYKEILSKKEYQDDLSKSAMVHKAYLDLTVDNEYQKRKEKRFIKVLCVMISICILLLVLYLNPSEETAKKRAMKKEINEYNTTYKFGDAIYGCMDEGNEDVKKYPNAYEKALREELETLNFYFYDDYEPEVVAMLKSYDQGFSVDHSLVVHYTGDECVAYGYEEERVKDENYEPMYILIQIVIVDFEEEKQRVEINYGTETELEIIASYNITNFSLDTIEDMEIVSEELYNEHKDVIDIQALASDLESKVDSVKFGLYNAGSHSNINYGVN